MKIIICGATGFIGQNLLRHYDNGENHVVAIFNKKPPITTTSEKVRWVQADLRLPGSISKELEGTDLFLQFAATTSGAKDIVQKPYIHVTDNAVMNSYLLRECCERNVGHFIFPSCTVMLASQEEQKETDWDPAQEIHPTYFGVANTKIYIEKMCNFYSKLGLKTTVIRHSNVYGPYDKFDLERSHVLGATIAKVISAKEDTNIEVWGSGKARRDFIYVKDLIDFIDKAYVNQSNKYGFYNCGMGYSISINELVQTIIQVSNKRLEMFNNTEKPDIPTALSLDCTKAREDLEWEKTTELEDGLRETYKWAELNISF